MTQDRQFPKGQSGLSARMRHLWRHHRAASLGFALVLTLTMILAVRAAVFALHWSDPARQEAAIEAWMTPRYILRSRELPPDVLEQALGMTTLPGKRQTLEDIATQRGVPVELLLAAVEAAIARHRAGSGAP